MKITKQSRELMARIVQKAFDQENDEKKSKEIVELAEQLNLPNAGEIKKEHENFKYNPF